VYARNIKAKTELYIIEVSDRRKEDYYGKEKQKG